MDPVLNKFRIANCFNQGLDILPRDIRLEHVRRSDNDGRSLPGVARTFGNCGPDVVA